MKEAASESSMTVIAIILIGIIVAVATPIVTNMMSSTKDRATCLNRGECFDPASSGDGCVPCGDGTTGTSQS